MELAYKRWNSDISLDHGQKLLFLHGMGGTGALWRPIAAGLEDHYDILAPDQRGHGLSRIEPTPDGREVPRYTPLDYGQDLVETLDGLKFHPLWVIGHSMGVRSACALAHLRPEWVNGLVLIDLGFSGPAGGGLGEGLAQFLQKLPMSFESRAKARDFMNAECPDPSIGQYLMAVAVPEARGIGLTSGITFPFDRDALISTIHATRDISVRAWVREMGEAGKPVLVLRGALSQVWSYEDFEAERRELSKYPSIVFEEVAGTGHGLPFEKRPWFVERVKRFACS